MQNPKNNFSFIILLNSYQLIITLGPQSRTLQPVRGEGYEPAHKSRANAETHPRLGVGGCGISKGWWKTLHWKGKPQYKQPTTSTTVSQLITNLLKTTADTSSYFS